jgi:hemolysin D
MAELHTLPVPAGAKPPQKVPSQPGAAKRPIARRILPHVEDRAFLAAALEIVETPPSPIRMALMTTIGLLATAALVWSWFGQIDIHATARGKLEPVGHTKVVQPLESGVVADIRVTEGQLIHAGEIVLVLEDREVQADLAAAVHGWTAAQAEALRRQAAIDAVRAGQFETVPAITWPEAIPPATRTREEAVLRSDLAELSKTVANLQAQTAEKQASVAQFAMSEAGETMLLQREAERVQLRETLAKEGNGSRLNLLDAQQSLLETRTQLDGDEGHRLQAIASVETLRTERMRQIEAFLADNQRKLADARRSVDEKTQDAAKARARLDRLTLRAPVDGAVQALAVTNLGQVVTSGQEVMRVVPLGGALEVLAYVLNEDVGFVQPGQTAVVKVDSFPFTRFGTIDAEVVSLAYDAIPGDAASGVTADATHQGDRSGQAQSPTAKPMTDLVYEARLKPHAQAIEVNGRAVPLVAGMTVTVEVKTGRRRVLEYLFSPIVEVMSGAGGER